MIYPVVDLEEWCQRYGLEPIEQRCYYCGHKQLANVPCAEGDYRGLMSIPHLCPYKKRFWVAIDINDTNKPPLKFMKGLL